MYLWVQLQDISGIYLKIFQEKKKKKTGRDKGNEMNKMLIFVEAEC